VGDFVTFQKGSLTATVWKDKKQVNFLSTNCDPTEIDTVSRRQKDGSRVDVDVPLFQNVTQHTCLVLIEQINYECNVLLAERLSNGGNTFVGFYLIWLFAMHLSACVKVTVTNL